MMSGTSEAPMISAIGAIPTLALYLVAVDVALDVVPHMCRNIYWLAFERKMMQIDKGQAVGLDDSPSHFARVSCDIALNEIESDERIVDYARRFLEDAFHLRMRLFYLLCAESAV